MSEFKTNLAGSRYGLAIVLIVFLIFAWLSSGSLTPYALQDTNAVSTECGYLKTVDHGQFEAHYNLFTGKPNASWRHSVVLRRILYPLASFPFQLAFGFDNGGFIFNLLLYSGFLLLFYSYVKKHYSAFTAFWSSLLMASYPGIHYWVYLPYSYVMIVPLSCVLFLILERIAKVERYSHLKELALALGICFTGYDLMSSFYLVFLYFILTKKLSLKEKFKISLTPFVPLFIVMIFFALLGAPLKNSNSSIYGQVIGSYLRIPNWDAWGTLLLQVPKNFLETLLFSGHFSLPIAAVVLFVCLRMARIRATHSKEIQIPKTAWFIGANILIFFAVLNFAPPYEAKWVMRGSWISRAYQSLFVLEFFIIITALEWACRNPKQLWFRIATFCMVGGVLLTFSTTIIGIPLGWKYSEVVYRKFYETTPENTITASVEKFGFHPWGLCKNAENQEDTSK